MDKSCVFCKIVAGEIPSYKVLEDDNFVAFLGIFPRFLGMTVVVTKQHFGGYLYETLDENLLTGMHNFSRKVALAIDKALGSFRCFQVMEGMEVDHAHLKLFPVYKDKYYDFRLEGEKQVSDDELSGVAQKIRKAVSEK